MNVSGRDGIRAALKQYAKAKINDDEVGKVAAWKRYQLEKQAYEQAELVALDKIEMENRNRLVAAGVKPEHYAPKMTAAQRATFEATRVLPVYEYDVKVKRTASGFEYDMPAINAAHLGSDFNFTTDKMLTADKTVRMDRDRFVRGEPMNSPKKVIAYLITALKDAAPKVIKEQLGESFLELLPKKNSADKDAVMGDNLDEMVAVCVAALPSVKSHKAECYKYDDGKYHKVGDGDMLTMIQHAFTDKRVLYGAENNPKQGLSSQHRNEILSWYKTERAAEIQRGKIVLFKNGYLDIDTNQFSASTPDLFAIGGPACNYEPSARCPNWMKFLDDQWVGDSASVALMQELMGLFLVDDTTYHTCTVLWGVPRSGKGTLLRLLKTMVGDEYTSHFSVSSLCSGFGLGSMMSTTLATSGDIRGPFDAKLKAKAREVILGIAGGDDMYIDRKNKEALNASVRARLVMSFNEIDDVRTLLLDGKGATAARLRALQFKNSFVGKEDRTLDAKLASELPGITNWAIEGLRRLEAQGFTMNEATERLRVKTKQTNIPEFMEDKNITFPVNTAVAYKKYREWCEESGNKAAPIQWFRTQVEDHTGVSYTENARCCAEHGCKNRGRFFFMPTDDVAASLLQALQFKCEHHSRSEEDAAMPERCF